MVWLSTNVAPKDRDIAMVFQNYALYSTLDCIRQHGFRFEIACEKYSKEDIDKRVQEAAEILVWKNSWTKPADLSGGQRQRVAMGQRIVQMQSVLDGRAIAQTNLTQNSRVSMRAEIAKIHRRIGATPST